ncbi:prepilin-type N-terminal cleavage/methylation domain-containing protein [Sporosarcina luteola]|uniref:type IV pilin protein n=1 Tax=Sporosarcina luteola TaxID=582850 RepID=UPI00204192CE|nr:prepilin-type N-terminal cleavage/methylation domain-containing protein [Sporosarcina luteola]MCM3637278.1 prepilin-type N-terminal cleavage/methylation domain-containing protein [Sporosarcina luteola]
MKKLLQKRLNNEKGLTLVELLAVIVILGIIAAIAVPSIGNIITNSKVNALKADGQNVLAAANMYFVENNTVKTVDSEILKTEGFLEDAGGFAAAGGVKATVSKVDSGNTISGTSANGDTKVAFEGATNKDISTRNAKAGTANKITVTR